MIRGPVLVAGASRGIGREVAAELARRDVKVFGTSRDPSRVSDPFPGVTFIPLRLESEESVLACAAAAGGIEVLVNNAAQSLMGAVEDVPVAEIEEIFAMNLFGLVRLTKEFLPGMRERGRGTIVNLGSLAGTFTPPFQSAYAASKAGLEAFSKTLRGEVGKHGIKVVHVVPGYIRTLIEPRMTVPDGSPYGEELGRFRAARDAKMDKAPSPDKVAGKILRILENENPRPVYYLGRGTPLMGFVRRLLPERLALSLIRRFYRL
jgi:short-subunit dehydrogenase